MKRILTVIMAVLVCTTIVPAKTADKMRVYINPGHGSWTSNDRPMNTIREVNGTLTVINPGTPSTTPDTTAFFESNTNLRKGFGMLEELVNSGFTFDREKGALDLTNNIVMSRVISGPYPTDTGESAGYNRNLTEICKEVESNNFDLFVSIHSDAATDGSSTNAALALYRGHTTPTAVTGCTEAHQTASRALATSLYSQLVTMTPTSYSTTATSRIQGDMDFYANNSSMSCTTNSLGYAGCLGVLKHGTTGVLMEGYCHTYQPARHRAMNWDVCYAEGISYARGLCDYAGISMSGNGLIYGIVRDKEETFTHTYYTPRASSADIYKPVNGALVTLKDSEGTTVDTYTTDNNYNGAFVFKNLTPGNYTVDVAKEGYALYSTTVTVKKDSGSYPAIYLGDVPSVDYGNFPDPAADAGIVSDDNFTFTPEYIDLQIPELAGCKMKRMIADGDYLYILAHNTSTGAPVAIVYDHAAKSTVTTLGTSTCTGDVTLSDIALTGDKYLVGINSVTIALGGTATGKIYKWSKDSDGLPTGEPKTWLTTNLQGNWSNGIIGETMCYIGNSSNGTVVYPAQSASNTSVRMVCLDIADGTVNSANSHYDLLNSVSGYTKTELGDLLLFPSPFSQSKFILNGSLKTGVELPIPEANRAVPTILDGTTTSGEKTDIFNTTYINKKVNHTGIFKYGGSVYTYVQTYVSDTSESKNTRLVKLTDNLQGTSRPTTNINTTNIPLEQLSADNECTTGTTVVSTTATGATNGVQMALFQLRCEGLLTKLIEDARTIDVPEDPVEPQDPDVEPEDPEYDGETHYAEYAYNLSATLTDGNIYNLSYHVTGDDAIGANLVLTPAQGTGEVLRYELDAPVKGLNTTQLSAGELDADSYTWAVEIISKSNKNGGVLFSESTEDTPVGARGGVVVITDPTQPTFGYSVVSYAKAGGFDIYAPDRTRLHVKALQGDTQLTSTHASSPMRGDQLEGKAVFCDYSDASGGYWLIDPAEPTSLTQLLQGERESSGLFTYNDMAIGGSNTCAAFVGQNTDQLKLYSFVEDYPTGNPTAASYRIRCYNMGAKRVIDCAPDDFGASNLNGNSRLANKIVDIVAADKGLFVTQARGASTQGTSTPCFMFIDFDGNELFNSATISEWLPNGCSGAVALNRGGDMLAVKGYTSNIYLFDVAWDGSTPSFTQAGVIETDTESTFSHMRFDYAGNLHVFNGQSGNSLSSNFKIYGLPSVKPVNTTPAPASSLLYSVTTGVNDITADTDADVSPQQTVYYNLQGQRVNASSLTPGIYIKVQGKESRKVIVR